MWKSVSPKTWSRANFRTSVDLWQSALVNRPASLVQHRSPTQCGVWCIRRIGPAQHKRPDSTNIGYSACPFGFDHRCIQCIVARCWDVSISIACKISVNFYVYLYFRNEQIGILAITRKAKKSILSIRLNGTINENRIYELRIAYSGSIWTTVEGLFRGQYVDMDTGEKKYVEHI